MKKPRSAPTCFWSLTAGEKEWLSWQERKELGVPVGESIQKECIQLRDEFNLPYKFPFEA